MRIVNADISMAARQQQREYIEHRTMAGERVNTLGPPLEVDTQPEAGDRTLEQSPTYEDIRRQIAQLDRGKFSISDLQRSGSTVDDYKLAELDSESRFKLELIKRLYESLTGRKFHGSVTDGQIERPSAGASSSSTSSQSDESQSAALQVVEGEAVVSVEQVRVTRVQEQQLTFQAAARVETADGEILDIDLSLSMGRRTAETLGFEMAVVFKDPLVVNFEGAASELTDSKFYLDLDLDGSPERLHKLDQSSGFLALDRNGNQHIDDGSELFGAQSGNGFADLAEYDEDGNGFIDEGDSVYDKLRIWVQHEDGSQSLFSLAEKGIGALYLGYQTTDWELRTEQSDTLAGRLRATGLFLREDGQAGTLQQVDLRV